jgi:NAD(P)-dependent dehydrogenase (short-subunit alcohol dehydrogenase family)
VKKRLPKFRRWEPKHFLFQGSYQSREYHPIFDETISRFGGVDVAINTVGMVLKKPFAETTEAEYDTMFNVNSKSAYFFLQEAVKN